MFWYERVLTDDDVHAALLGPIRQYFTQNGQLMKLTKLDGYESWLDFGGGPVPSFP